MNRAHSIEAIRRAVVLGIGIAVFRLCVVAFAADESALPSTVHPPQISSGMSDVNPQVFEHSQAPPRWGRDPFAQPTNEEAMSGTLLLTSILYNPASAVAVINGQVVRAGDDVDGRRVVSIGPDHVIVREGKITRRLDVPRFTVENGKP
jgi:hypothetical protein